MDKTPILTKSPELIGKKDSCAGVHEVGVLLHSAAYAAFQAPMNALVQPFGGKEDRFLSAPKETKAWSKDWHLQQLGTGAGMLVPILLSRKIVTSLAPSATAELAASKGLEALTKKELTTLARYEFGTALGTGLVYGGVFTPSKLEPGQSLADARLRQAGSAATTFAALNLTTAGLKSLGTSERLKDTVMGKLLKNEVAVTALAGVPTGVVAVDAHSVFAGKGMPGLKEHFSSKYMESIYNFSVVGAGLGYLGGPRKAAETEKAKIGLERSATSDLSIKSSRELLGELSSRLNGEGKVADFDLSAVPAPKLSFERDVRNLPRLKEGAELNDSVSVSQFERDAIEYKSEPVRIYEAEGSRTRVIVPEEYALKLDRLAELKEQSLRKDAVGEKARAELDTPEMRELSDRMTVAEAFKHAQMTPEPAQFREIHLLGTENPYDAYYRAKTGNADFVSAADTIFKRGQTNWYKKDGGPSLLEDTMHEWTHLFDENHPLDAQVIRIANEIDNLDTRAYANVPRERMAILVGEYALHANGRRAGQLMEAAPVTSLAVAEGLLNVLGKVPEGQQSALHAQIKARAEAIKTAVEPIARKTLLEQIQENPGSAEANAAFKALVFLGQAKDLNGMRMESVDLRFEPLTDARGTRLGQIEGLTDLNLEHTFVGPETMRALDGKPLQSLVLANTRVNNSSLSFLPQSLRNLDLSGTKIGDQSVPFLQRLQRLETLDVRGTQLSQTGLDRLKAALQNTEIIE
ncbi:MAG: hypothetical protein K2X27_01640 [Candidatus Obscuribacterales bacterium]|nr:hypothetical protein [Candidatus Obscuribacterales bacterium]